MRIVNLIENTDGKSGCLFEHGLSFYIETKKHKLLVDAGQSNAFISNATKLNVDLEDIDTVILSHGHYDHSGGILDFAGINHKAKIIMQQVAIGDFYHKNEKLEKYIGIDKRICDLPNIEYANGNKKLDDELYLFSGVTGRRLWPKGNLELVEKRHGDFYQDEFGHEQYLVISEGTKNILVSGCAHNGVLNILEKYNEIYGSNPDIVISGFHMRKNGDYTEEELEIIRETAKELTRVSTRFYTGHCTGEIPYQIMKEYMGEQLVYVHSGDEINI